MGKSSRNRKQRKMEANEQQHDIPCSSQECGIERAKECESPEEGLAKQMLAEEPANAYIAQQIATKMFKHNKIFIYVKSVMQADRKSVV